MSMVLPPALSPSVQKLPPLSSGRSDGGQVQLPHELRDLDELKRLTWSVAELTPSVSDTAASAGSNSDRRTEAAFASLCGVNPIPASSGKTNRHRLNRGGDRQANAALYRIVIVWLPEDTGIHAASNRRGNQARRHPLSQTLAREVYSAIQKPAQIRKTDKI